jgi:hypothetical protein
VKTYFTNSKGVPMSAYLVRKGTLQHGQPAKRDQIEFYDERASSKLVGRWYVKTLRDTTRGVNMHADYDIWDLTEGELALVFSALGLNDPTRHYRVSWTIDVEASSKEEAAQLALKIQRDPTSIATVFDVMEDGAHDSQFIDLQGD